MKKRIDSFKYAFRGIAEGFREEVNIKIHLVAAIIAISMAFFFELRTGKFCIILLCCGAVISLELMNTAIEKLCDMIEPNKNDKIKVIKDISAAAVLVASVVSLIVGLMIFVPKIMEMIEN